MNNKFYINSLIDELFKSKNCGWKNIYEVKRHLISNCYLFKQDYEAVFLNYLIN